MRRLILAMILISTPLSAAELLLVGNKGEDTLSFVDLGTAKEVGRVPTGRMPHEIAISPDGKTAAVVSYGGKSIDLVDVASRTKRRTIELGSNEGPHGLVWLSDGRLIATTERSQSIVVVEPRTGGVVSIATGQPGTHMIAVSPDRRPRACARSAPRLYGEHPGRYGDGDRLDPSYEAARP
jgi:DNA-binding beta-propeller fold protein YncE